MLSAKISVCKLCQSGCEQVQLNSPQIYFPQPGAEAKFCTDMIFRLQAWKGGKPSALYAHSLLSSLHNCQRFWKHPSFSLGRLWRSEMVAVF